MRSSFVMLLLALSAAAEDGGVTAPQAAPAAGSIEVTITGLRNDTGLEQVVIYAGEDGFPAKPKKGREIRLVPIKDHAVTVLFENLPPGWYAIGTCHDENSNKDCDTNFLGIPTEGVACSNNAHKKNMIPQYEKAKLWVNAGQVVKAPISQISY